MEIEQETYEKCTYGTISSGGVANCIAIGILCPKMNVGYMMHYSNFKNDDELPKYLDDIIADLRCKQSLEIWVTGGRLVKEFFDNVQENRDYVETALLKKFEKNQIKFKWSKPNIIADLFLNVDTGEFYIEYE